MKFLLFFLLAITSLRAPAQVVCGAKSKGKWGVINTKGKWVIKPQFDSTSCFYNGYATIFTNQKKDGLINEAGRIIIAPIYDFVGEAENGMCLLGSKGKFGFYNLTTSEVIPPQFEDAEDFAEDLAGVQNQSGKWGFIDKQNHVIIPFLFDAVLKDFRGDTAEVTLGEDDVYINKLGKFIGPAISKPTVRKRELIGTAGQLGIKKPSGEIVMPPIYDYFGYAKDSVFWFRLKGKYGLADSNGRFIVGPDFDYLTYFSEGLAPARIVEKWGFIRPNGTIGLSFTYQAAHNFSHGLAAVKHQGLWGFIYKKGRWKIKPRFEDTGGNFRDIHSKYDPMVRFEYP